MIEKLRREAGLGAAIVLAGIGVIHAAWAMGSSWPARDFDALGAAPK